MAKYGITGSYKEIDWKVERKRYRVLGDPVAAPQFELIDADITPRNNSISFTAEKRSPLEYREYEVKSKEEAIRVAKSEGLVGVMLIRDIGTIEGWVDCISWFDYIKNQLTTTKLII